MKSKYIFTMAPFVPLLIVIILAIIGITLNFLVYIILAVVCPLVAGILWFIYKDMERKVTDAGSGSLRK